MIGSVERLAGAGVRLASSDGSDGAEQPATADTAASTRAASQSVDAGRSGITARYLQ